MLREVGQRVVALSDGKQTPYRSSCLSAIEDVYLFVTKADEVQTTAAASPAAAAAAGGATRIKSDRQSFITSLLSEKKIDIVPDPCANTKRKRRSSTDQIRSSFS